MSQHFEEKLSTEKVKEIKEKEFKEIVKEIIDSKLHHKDYKETKDVKDKDKDKEKDKEGAQKEVTKEVHVDKTHKDKDNPEMTAYAQFPVQPVGAGAPVPISAKSIYKEHKEIKQEIKEIKNEKENLQLEKLHVKEHIDKPVKLEYDAHALLPQIEQRLVALEGAVGQLLHFIPKEMRPDLSQGALKQEPDTAAQGKPVDLKDPGAKKS